MLAHAEEAYPNECCGAMIGRIEDGVKSVTRAAAARQCLCRFAEGALRNPARGPARADRAARRDALDLIGIYHSHPDCDAYFSETDLKNSCPWYSFVVLSIRGGRFDHVTSWLPNPEQTAAESEPMTYPERALWQES